MCPGSLSHSKLQLRRSHPDQIVVGEAGVAKALGLRKRFVVPEATHLLRHGKHVGWGSGCAHDQDGAVINTVRVCGDDLHAGVEVHTSPASSP